MRIAFIGLKGLPGTFSGVETHVHEIGIRLARRGHDVVAYVRPQYTPKDVHEDDGIRLVHLPTIPSKHLDASVHSFLSALHSIRQGYDIVHFHTIGPAAFAPIARLSGARVVTTIHRFDYLSGKWGWIARTCLQAAEKLSLTSSHRAIVIAPWLQAHYREKGHEVEYIPNGVPLPQPGIGTGEIEKLGLRPNEYFLFLGRLVPEKRPDWAIRAFLKSCEGTAAKLVIAGGSSSTDRYISQLKQLARGFEDRVLFPGAVYGEPKEEMMAHARAFLLPSALEGLPITLLEAMSHGRPCLVSDIPPHRDVIVDGRNGFLHKQDDFDHLCTRLRDLDGSDEATLAQVGKAATKTVGEEYDWDNIVDSLERFYESTLGRTPASHKV